LRWHYGKFIAASGFHSPEVIAEPVVAALNGVGCYSEGLACGIGLFLKQFTGD